MDAIKSGFNSTVYRLSNGLVGHKFDEEEGEYRKYQRFGYRKSLFRNGLKSYEKEVQRALEEFQPRE